jgi:type VI protein secretion system component VasK
MTVETPERAWTDPRLDDLKESVDKGFAEVDARFDKVDARFDKVDARFDKVDARFDKVDERFEKVDARFTKMDEKLDASKRELRGEMKAGFERVGADIREVRSSVNRILVALLVVGGGIIAALLKSHGF